MKEGGDLIDLSYVSIIIEYNCTRQQQQQFTRVPGTDEDFLVVALQHARLFLWDLNTFLDRQLIVKIELGMD